MNSKFLAHITEIDGHRAEHFLADHCREAAHIASDALTGAGLPKTGRLIGMLHDMGKYSGKFQSYIEAAFQGEKVKAGSVNHSFASVIWLLENYHNTEDPYQKLACEMLSYAVGSHHGLFDPLDVYGKNGFVHRLEKSREELCYEEAVHNFFEDCIREEELKKLAEAAVQELTEMTKRIMCQTGKTGKTIEEVYFYLGLLTRLMLSALVYGDWVSTGDFFAGQERTEGGKANWQEQLAYFEEKISGFSADTPINRARKYISDTCRAFAEKQSGIYRITVPTGGGKTLAALRYSLSHAAAHNKQRIFFVIPLLSVLEQNSKVIKSCLKNGDEIVLECHSNVIKSDFSEEELKRYELLSARWESPVIITTMFQFLNSLFDGKLESAGRMQSLGNSVIVIDEVQSVPKHLLSMFNLAMNFLAEYCGAAILLSSATQPCFEYMNHPMMFSADAELVPYQEELWKAFRRTQIIDKTTPHGMSMDELACFTLELTENTADSILIICNTKAVVLGLYRRLQDYCENSGYELYSLSNSMCMQNRIDVLEDINRSLEQSRREHQKVICVATQLVEAGVDFSFGSVIRVKAGLDNIAQSAGRCNRNGESEQLRPVYIVNLKEESLKMLPDIKHSQDAVGSILDEYNRMPERYQNNLLNEQCIRQYYQELFQMPEVQKRFDAPVKLEDHTEAKLFDLLSVNGIGSGAAEKQQLREYILHQAFAAAGKHFYIYENNTAEVIVPYNEQAKRIIKELCCGKLDYDFKKLKQLIEEAKSYTVQLFEYQRKQLMEQGMLISDEEHHFEALNEGCYSGKTGISFEFDINHYFL